MTRIRSVVAPLLAMLLVLQWSAASAHCLAPPGGGRAQPDPVAWTVPICGPGGAARQAAGPGNKPALPHFHLACPLCGLPVPAALQAPVPVEAPAAALPVTVFGPRRPRFVLAHPRAPPQRQPRAPPLLRS